jgi:hypothetical protein
MKKLIMLLILSTSIMGLNFAQENQQNGSGNLYTFFVNIVNEQFHFPLIGFVNIANGSHSLPQIGFVNLNQNNFNTLQIGFVNTVGGDMTGLQWGFINAVMGKNTNGLQLGFVSTAADNFNGAQISFVNAAKQLRGLQIGLVNYADSFEKGFPIGLLSIVRQGGYRAIELGASEISPFNISYKIGVDRFYTIFIVSYNLFEKGIRDQIMWGTGFGTIIPLGETFFVNPELTLHNGIANKIYQYISFTSYLGYNLISNLSIVAGPSVSWTYSNKHMDMGSPFYHIIEYSVNDDNKLYLGARAALMFRW